MKEWFASVKNEQGKNLTIEGGDVGWVRGTSPEPRAPRWRRGWSRRRNKEIANSI